jgi:hypothetical protein
LNVPRGIFVDGANNIYISDDGDNRVRKVQALNTGLGSGNITTVAGTGTACAGGSAACGDGAAATSAELNAPHSIWVDAAGNIYIADTSDNRVRKVAAGSGYIWTVAGNGTAGYVADGVAATGTELNQVKGLGMDSAGNLFLADTSNNRIREVNIAASQLTFPTSTAVGTLDATDDPQTAMVSNLGNASLTVATPASGTNPTVPASYLLDAATTCPELNTSSSPGTLAAGSDCAYAVDLDPAQTGALDGSVVLTDNSLAVTGSTQTISTSGTGIAVSTTTTLGSSANPSTYGGSVTFTATVAPVSGSAVPTGTAQFSIDGSNVGSPVTLSSGTATYATSTLTAAAHSVTAAYTTNSSSYNSSSSSTLTQTVNKATPTVSVWPTAGAIN